MRFKDSISLHQQRMYVGSAQCVWSPVHIEASHDSILHPLVFTLCVNDMSVVCRWSKELEVDYFIGGLWEYRQRSGEPTMVVKNLVPAVRPFQMQCGKGYTHWQSNCFVYLLQLPLLNKENLEYSYPLLSMSPLNVTHPLTAACVRYSLSVILSGWSTQIPSAPLSFSSHI